jgi:hypothetical protein
MKKILFAICIAFIGCSKDEPTCVVCYVDGVEAINICVEDYPTYTVEELRESIDPLLENEECHYYN